MKNARKLLAAVLAFVMIFALAATAFADGDDNTTMFTISVAEGDTHEYAIYQIFTGDYYKPDGATVGTLSNIKWGQNAADGKTGSVDGTITKNLALLASKSDTEKLEIIEEYVDFTKIPYETVGGEAPEGQDPKTSVEVDAGYYIIKDNGDIGAKDTYTKFIALVVGDVSIQRKASPIDFEKKIVVGTGDSRTEVEENIVNVGDSVNFELQATLPTAKDYAEYQDYYMCFSDKLTGGLKMQPNTVQITVGGSQYTGDYYIYGGKQDFKVVIYDLKTAVPTVADNTKVVVSYTAILTGDATIVGNAGNTNTASLKFSNDPNVKTDGKPQEPGDPGTPDDPTPPNPDVPTLPEVKGESGNQTTTTRTAGLKITKSDGDGNSPEALKNAAFTLTPDEETGSITNVVLTTGVEYMLLEGEKVSGKDYYYELKNGNFTTDEPTEDTAKFYKSVSSNVANEVTYPLYEKTEVNRVDRQNVEGKTVQAFVVKQTDGKYVAKFEGLAEGTYILTESVTPGGYNTADPKKVEIKWHDDQDDTKDGFVIKVDGEPLDLDKGLGALTVVNNAGVELPTTGGIGTTIFYVIGAIMVLGAGVLLITKKRMGM